MNGLSVAVARRELSAWATVAFAHSIALLLSNSFYAVADDEASIVLSATAPATATFRLFLSGEGQHEHPPLYDLLLHGWLEVTGYRYSLIRVPAALFSGAGVFLCARAAGYLAGLGAARRTLLLAAFWPLGFHFGRLAAWYSFCFMLVALLTGEYLRLLKIPTISALFRCWAAAYLLVMTNYFGFFMLGILGLHLVFQNRRAGLVRWRHLSVATLALIAGYGPVWGAFLQRTGMGVQHPESVAGSVLNVAFSLYALIASESVAPWYLPWGLIVALGVSVILTTMLVSARGPSLVLLLGGACCVGVMAVAGVLLTKRLMFLGAWLLVPWGAFLGAQGRPWTRRLHSGALFVVGAISFGGIVQREHYAAMRFVEPWPQLSSEALRRLERQETVVTNSGPLLFEVSWRLALQSWRPTESFAAALARVPVEHPRLLACKSGAPTGYQPEGRMWFVRGQSEPGEMAALGSYHSVAESTCARLNESRILPDDGFTLKKRWFPNAHQIPYRLVISEFNCLREGG